MKYQILGPLRVTNNAGNVAIRARQMEVVLATLLIRADQVVSPEQLVTEIWGENPPRRSTAAIYVYISQLRKLLSPQGGEDSPIVTQSPGYVLRAEPGDLDLHLFERLVGEGRKLIRLGHDEKARVELEAAMALWHGPALVELRNGPIINGFAIWMEELRLECTEMQIEANLRLGRHREFVGMLQELIRVHPLHEAFYRQLMMALWHSERRADALGVYRLARETLSRELGLEPGRRLRELQRAVLSPSDEFETTQLAG